MSIPATIPDDIETGLNRAVSHRTLNGSCVIDYGDGESIRIPVDSIVSKYYYLLEPYLTTVEVSEEETRIYQYAPKKFCQDMYGTPEYWSIILYLNDCHSIIDFTMENTVTIINPQNIDEVINEIMILEGNY